MNYPANTYRIRQDSSFLYFFGLDAPNLIGLIDLESGDSFLFGDDPDLDDVIWSGTPETMAERAVMSGVRAFYPLKDISDVLGKAQKMGRTVHYLPQYRAMNCLFLTELLGIPATNVSKQWSLSLVKAIVPLRSKKESCEIEEIEKACAIGRLMHLYAMKHAKEGRLEKELAGTLEGLALSHGANVSFPVILTQQGEVLHQHHHGGQLQNGKLLLVDAGAESLLHYASDFTRTTPVGHCFSEVQKDIYNIVLEANNHARSLMKPDIRYIDVHRAASRIMVRRLNEIGLMKGDVDEAVAVGAHALFFPHGLGHLMGLDVHDMEDYGQIHVGFDEETQPVDQFGTGYLRFGRRLEPGYVLTVEPGIYFIPPLIEKWSAEKKHADFICYDQVRHFIGFGGIRIEDDVLIETAGARILGTRLPVSIEEIETINTK
jgi:Xaa-Pro aminopeptidase